MINNVFGAAKRGRFIRIGLFSIFATIVFHLLSPAPKGAIGWWATVKHVIDGDTVVLCSGKKVRYMGINAPEIAHEPGERDEPFGRKALEENRRLVKGRRVRLEPGPESRDRFGRALAYLFLPDGTMVNERLVRNGLAYVCAPSPAIPHFDTLLNAQRYAISHSAGIWSVPASRPERYYIANKRSLRFHRPSCPYGRNTGWKNRKIFPSREEAARHGFCPCRKCNP